jgi:hypothetical protein
MDTHRHKHCFRQRRSGSTPARTPTVGVNTAKRSARRAAACGRCASCSAASGKPLWPVSRTRPRVPLLSVTTLCRTTGDFRQRCAARASAPTCGQGWRQIKHGGPTLQAEAELSPTSPYEGQYSLRLSVATNPAPAGRGAAGMVPLTVVTSPLRVTSGQMLRISGWVRKPGGHVGGTAAVLQESATAAPASLRWWQTEGWQPFTLYRPAPASGRFELSLVMPGVGDVYFDDLAVEPIHLPNQLAQERAAIDRQ